MTDKMHLSPCMDCPYLRLTDKMHLSHDEAQQHIYSHFTEDGGYESVECEEQGTQCAGQVQMIANGLPTGLDEFSDLGEAVAQTKRNWKDYFIGPWEWRAFHER